MGKNIRKAEVRAQKHNLTAVGGRESGRESGLGRNISVLHGSPGGADDGFQFGLPDRLPKINPDALR